LREDRPQAGCSGCRAILVYEAGGRGVGGIVTAGPGAMPWSGAGKSLLVKGNPL